jgi:hypothetical protein
MCRGYVHKSCDSETNLYHSCKVPRQAQQILYAKGVKELGYSDWTMVHGFYADMGGFVLHGPGIEAPCPVDALQLLFLLKHECIEYPRIAKEDINDRNKSDGFARCIAVFQAVWMVVNCLTRVAQGLTMTTLELTTLSFILVFFVTSFCWYHKPQDITTTVPIHTVVHIDQILAEVCLHAEIRWYRGCDIENRMESTPQISGTTPR